MSVGRPEAGPGSEVGAEVPDTAGRTVQGLRGRRAGLASLWVSPECPALTRVSPRGFRGERTAGVMRYPGRLEGDRDTERGQGVDTPLAGRRWVTWSAERSQSHAGGVARSHGEAARFCHVPQPGWL